MSPVTRAWVVTLSGLGINLALGVLYTWSVVAQVLTRSAAEGGLHLWTVRQANLPFAFAVGAFALTMVFAGRLQDEFGPRWVATAGGVMVGLGMIVSSLSPVRLASGTAFPYQMVLGFGVLTGIGIGLAYASTTPAAVKWFSASKRGLIAGVVVSGFALASLYAAPLTTVLIRRYGVNEAFVFLGVICFVVIAGLAQFLENPPKGFVPPGSYTEVPSPIGPRPTGQDYAWHQVLREPSFYLLWTMFACVSFAGLMVVSVISKVAVAPLGVANAAAASYVMLATLSLGNGLGRPVLGFASDRIGRQRTMLVSFLFQALLLMGMRSAATGVSLALIAFFIGFNYGGALTLFPATTFDFFGTKHGGADYGLVFTAWGAGGVLGWLLAGWALDRSTTPANPGGSYALACSIAAVLCVLAAGLALALRPPSPAAPLGRRRAD